MTMSRIDLVRKGRISVGESKVLKWIVANRALITVVISAGLAILSIVGHLDCGTAATVHGVLDALGFQTPLECSWELVTDK